MGSSLSPSHVALEGDGPRVAAVDAERLVGALEAAVAEAAQDDVLADPQDDEIGVAVAVDVERVGAGDGGQVGDRRRQRGEAQRTAALAVVVVQRGRSLPPAKYSSLRPSSSQSKAATPPPTKYWKSPV